jgi:DNA-binding transcriptional LysR family regulator
VGIAELACFLCDRFPNVIRVWPHEPPARRAVWLILHQDMRRSARIRAVSAAVSEAFRHQRNTLAEGIRSKSGSH